MENVENAITEKLTLRSHTSRLSEHLSFTEMFSTRSHTSRLSEHLSATKMLWTTLTAYMFLKEENFIPMNLHKYSG